MRRMLSRAALCLVSVMIGVGVLGGVAGASKVNPAAATVSLTEGNAQIVTLTLDQPIIAPGPDPGLVTLDLTVADPSRVSLSASSVSWPATQWFQPRQVTVTALHDGVHNASNTVVVQGLVSSNSAYYDAFATSITVTIADVDPAPTTTTTTVASTTTVAPAPSTTVAAVSPTTTASATARPARRVAARTAELAETGASNGLLAALALSAIGLGVTLVRAGGSVPLRAGRDRPSGERNEGRRRDLDAEPGRRRHRRAQPARRGRRGSGAT